MRGRGKKTNPLLSPKGRIAPVPSSRTNSDPLAIKTLQFEFPPKLWAQQEVDDLCRPYFEEQVQVLGNGYQYWLNFRGLSKEYFTNQDAAARSAGLEWPFLNKETIEAMKESQNNASKITPYLNKASGFGDPWSNHATLIWKDLLLQTLMHGPDGQKLAVEMYFPALEAYSKWRTRYNQADRAHDSLQEIIDPLRRLQNNGVFDPNDATALRKHLHHRHFQTHGRNVSWNKELIAGWASAAKDVLQSAEAEKFKGETPDGLRLLVAFKQQIAAPFNTVIDDALMDPTWTISN